VQVFRLLAVAWVSPCGGTGRRRWFNLPEVGDEVHLSVLGLIGIPVLRPVSKVLAHKFKQ
jgi:hypothetical protein